MLKSNLLPPTKGPGSDPVLYGVAAGLAQLYPPVTAPTGREAGEMEQDKARKLTPRRD